MDENIHRFCHTIFELEAGEQSTDSPNWVDYQKSLEYIKQTILKAFAVINKDAEPHLQQKLQAAIAEVEAAPTGEIILGIVENISAATR